jgi:maltooligosyltrehalose trehalohydrolase
MKIGANCQKENCEFTVWAPYHNKVSLVVNQEQPIPMNKDLKGYWKLTLKGIRSNTQYRYKIDQKGMKPDPASHFQPQGVFGASAVVDHHAFNWNDKTWRAPNLADMVLYELHVGTFTKEGTLSAIVPRIKQLSELGVNALELMPVTQFSGERNWGYDSVFPFAVQNTYGGPLELKRLVQACHASGVAVVLDVIYNHVGPEGSCLADFGPYFLESRITPWGSSINFDGKDCREVRNYFLENALFWFENYHVDALRLDAVHAIMDVSPKHILKEMSETVDAYLKQRHKKGYLIAETNQNDQILIQPRSAGGFGLDAQWLDDFHHALHALVTGEKAGYYVDFGHVSDLAKALHKGLAYSGQFSPFFETKQSTSSKQVLPERLVVFSQNHDQIGNRARGERLVGLAGWEAAKLAAALVILSPYVPLLFMGEEYGEQAPFLYFTSFSDQTLADKVRKGRRKEHQEEASFSEIPDPQSIDTFMRSKINWEQRSRGASQKMLEYYQRLLQVRKHLHGKSSEQNFRMEVAEGETEGVLLMSREGAWGLVANFNSHEVKTALGSAQRGFVKVLDSANTAWVGQGAVQPKKPVSRQVLVAPLSVAVYANADLVKVFE